MSRINYCVECVKKRFWNTFDRSRRTAYKNFKKKERKKNDNKSSKSNIKSDYRETTTRRYGKTSNKFYKNK